jgi:hypothetical protein
VSSLSVFLGSSATAAVLLIAQSGESPSPTTLIGVLGILVTGIAGLLGLVVRWLLTEVTSARKDAVDAWKAVSAASEKTATAVESARDAERAAFQRILDSVKREGDESRERIDRERALTAELENAERQRRSKEREILDRQLEAIRLQGDEIMRRLNNPTTSKL